MGNNDSDGKKGTNGMSLDLVNMMKTADVDLTMSFKFLISNDFIYSKFFVSSKQNPLLLKN
jgi:hypothetical protein